MQLMTDRVLALVRQKKSDTPSPTVRIVAISDQSGKIEQSWLVLYYSVMSAWQ